MQRKSLALLAHHFLIKHYKHLMVPFWSTFLDKLNSESIFWNMQWTTQLINKHSTAVSLSISEVLEPRDTGRKNYGHYVLKSQFFSLLLPNYFPNLILPHHLLLPPPSKPLLLLTLPRPQIHLLPGSLRELFMPLYKEGPSIEFPWPFRKIQSPLNSDTIKLKLKTSLAHSKHSTNAPFSHTFISLTL